MTDDITTAETLKYLRRNKKYTFRYTDEYAAFTAAMAAVKALEESYADRQIIERLRVEYYRKLLDYKQDRHNQTLLRTVKMLAEILGKTLPEWAEACNGETEKES